MKRLLILLAAAVSAAAQAEAGPDYAVTIYSRAQPGAVDPALYRPGGRSQPEAVPGYATVRQDQSFELAQGVSELSVRDVASLIDPTTVSIRSPGEGEPVRVLEQSFEFDLVSSAKLLDRYLDREVTVTRSAGNDIRRLRGTLLSTDGGLVLRKPDGGVQIVKEYRGIELPELPGELITRPTLVWQVHSDEAATIPLRISYQTAGMTWWADYNATLNEASGCRLDLNAWVSIVNQSGAGYPGTRLKLIAGDVQRISPQEPRITMELARAADAPEQTGFQEKSFFEYHLYTLPRQTSLPDNSTKQLELFPATQDVPCNKEYVYDQRGGFPGYGSRPVLDRDVPRRPDEGVAVSLTFRNDEASGLGMPLPAGRLRISKQDEADGSLEFIGEDVIDHTPRNEDLRVGLGDAFDVVAERTRMDFTVDTSARIMRESFEIRVRNHKEAPITVNVKETLYRWVTWNIARSSHDYEKLDARSIQFAVDVAADEEAVLSYEVRYNW